MPASRTKLVLPKPDCFRDYWIGTRGYPPAILPSKDGGYFATTEDGPLVDGRALRKFRTPVEALAAIEAAEK